MYDPEYHSAQSSIMDEPDASQAHKWYLRAAERGDSLATERLAHLRRRVERAAADGDPDAQRLALQWR